MLQLNKANKEHEKRARATQLIYKQAELGYVEVPRTYNELQQKVASLMNQDLTVVEKAIEITGGEISLGTLEGGSSDNITPEAVFVNAISDQF